MNASDSSILRSALSIAVATGFYAVSFGVLAVAAGLSVAQTCVMSIVTFTGASQFSFVSVVAAGGGAAAALTPALVLAVRNGVYALSLRGVITGGTWRRLARTHLVIDESTAMALAQQGLVSRRRAFDLTGLSIFVAWNIGTAIGAVAGSGLGDPRKLGLDAVFPAVFLGLLVPQVRDRRALLAGLAGGVVALALIPFAPAGVPVLACALVCVPILVVRPRRRSR